jgi:hypothetical protein
MAGLLDFLQTPAGQGLLTGVASYAANAGRGQPVNSIGRGLLGGLAGYGVATDRQAELAQQAKRNELWDAQLGAYKTDAATKQAALDRQRAQIEALPTLFSQTSPGAFAPSIDGMGPTMPQSMQAPPKFDALRAASLGFTPEQIKAYAELPNAGRAKVARTIERDDGRGGKETLQVDEFGQAVGDALPAYLAPVQVNQGDRVTMVRPAAGVSLPVNMSPDAKASNAVAWANNAVARERLAIDKNGGTAPAGYRWNADRSALEAVPGGPAALGKALPTKLASDLGEQATVVDSTERFKSTFKPGYGGKTVLGELDNTSKRVFGDDTGQAQWWQDYALHEATVRNKLFGASLTGNEQANWLKLTVTPRMDPAQIADNIKRRAEIEANALARMTAGAAAGGYNKEQIEAVTGRPVAAKPTAGGPMKGQVVDGFKFMGGNPADPASWERTK